MEKIARGKTRIKKLALTRLNMRLCAIQGIVTDMDGVLTNGSKAYSIRGLEQIQFNVRDGLGMELLKLSKFKIAVVTSTDSPIVDARMRDFPNVEVYKGIWDKQSIVRQWRIRHGLPKNRVLYMGDDLWDIFAFTEAGISVAVADASQAVRDAADWVTLRGGGTGAFREMVDKLLAAKKINPLKLIEAECK